MANQIETLNRRGEYISGDCLGQAFVAEDRLGGQDQLQLVGLVLPGGLELEDFDEEYFLGSVPLEE